MAANTRDMIWAEKARTCITDLVAALTNYAALADENTKANTLTHILDPDLTAWGMTKADFQAAITAATALRATFDLGTNGRDLFRAARN